MSRDVELYSSDVSKWCQWSCSNVPKEFDADSFNSPENGEREGLGREREREKSICQC